MSESDTSESEAMSMSAPAAVTSWQEQDGVLREMWLHHQTPAAIAQALNRSVAAIMTRAARLGLPRRSAPGRKPGRRTSDTGVNSSTAMGRSAMPRTNNAASETIEVSSQTMERVCLMCLGKFQSIGRHNRICSNCKNSAEYESGARLPDLHFPVE